MSHAEPQIVNQAAKRRLLPAVVIAVVTLGIRYLLPAVYADGLIFALIGGMVGVAAILVWWLFFSGFSWTEKIGGVLAVAATLAVVRLFLHPSVATGGMGVMFYMLALPPMSVAAVAAVILAIHKPANARFIVLVIVVAVAGGVWTLFRTEGVRGSGFSDFRWRWSATAEERLLERGPENPVVSSAVAEAVGQEPEWPGFRGKKRDSIVSGTRIASNWEQSPPKEIWRRPVGPGWSSFAVWGDRLFTQEQRGDEEVVACYSAATGGLLWLHGDKARFWESNAGPGPRATPAIDVGVVYTLGATGLLNALNAASGEVVWSRNAVEDTGIQIPDWGISGSPLIVDSKVIVAVSGRLVAFEITTGRKLWEGPSRQGSYCSPHLIEIDGISQVVMTGGAGVFSVSPESGELLWEHEWEGSPILQPALIGNGEIIVTTRDGPLGSGIRRLQVLKSDNHWAVEEKWTSSALKPYFNDYVVHEGYAYGLDGRILACVDLKDGSRKWKGGRYGHGQIILIADQDLLLVLSEEGELALISAQPDQFSELARHQAISGKTWNHPVLVDQVLYVRNGEEMAAFRLGESAD
jgi:outer membrane protein assembly factor BamB